MSTGEWEQTANLWFLVRQIAGRFDRVGDALYRSELQISLAQFLVLSVVDAAPGSLNQQAIADRLGLTKGTVSRQIEAAVDAGRMTVEPASHSRRENIVSLTPSGTELVRRGDQVLAVSLERHLPKIDRSDLAVTIATLTAINTAVGGAPLPRWKTTLPTDSE